MGRRHQEAQAFAKTERQIAFIRETAAETRALRVRIAQDDTAAGERPVPYCTTEKPCPYHERGGAVDDPCGLGHPIT